MESEDLKKFHKELVDWLMNSKIVSDQGEVYSWLNPEKPGYAYYEIIGYYIKLFSELYKRTKDEKYLQQAIKSADFLSSNLNEKGSVSRYDIEYVFDSAICASGLFALAKVTDLKPEHEAAAKKLMDFVYSSLEKKQVAFDRDQPLVELNRWSLSYGSLIIKNCMALYEAYEYFKDEKFKKMAEQVADEITKGAFKQDHFTINKDRDFVYTHPHCYATEGLLFMQSKGYDYKETIEKAADWLASNQNEDGSMFNFYLKPDAKLEKQGDATSQAIRIWCCIDKEKYKENIKKATSFIKSLQSGSEGLAYNKNEERGVSPDTNSWVSIFAAQALLWQLEDPDKEWIV